MKKFLLTIFITLLCINCISYADSSFPDLGELTEAQRQSIENIYNIGLMSEYPDETFRPFNSFTIKSFITIFLC